MAEPAPDPRRFDLVCLGRAAVDLYGEQLGSPLEDVLSFARSLGGSAANIAVGAARQGLRVAMLSRVGDEHMGRFVRAALEAEGIDTTGVKTDPDRLTGLVLLSVRDRERFPHIFYRERCADMALSADDLDPALLASARALVLTGTHLSEPGVERASRAALALARAAGARVLLDIDYRPVLWGLAGHGDGEARALASRRASELLLSVVAECELVVGTEEELRVAGGCPDTLAAVRALRARTAATIVMKRGPLGCLVFAGELPARLEDAWSAPGLEVEVLNALGAGDAFLAGFLRGWLEDEPLAACCRYANACGALVASRHGCAPAMPTRAELDLWLATAGGTPAASAPRIDRDPGVRRLHRVGTRRGDWPELFVLAMDHRRALEAMADRAGAPRARLPALKRLLLRAARDGAEAAGAERAGLIIDERYGRDALDLATGSGWWLARPIERASGGGPEVLDAWADAAREEPALAGGPRLELEGGARFALDLKTWPAEHVVKCLVHYHPDAPQPARGADEERLVELQRVVDALDRELLLEVLPLRGGAPDPAALPRALEALYARGVRPDWWKLPPPSDRASWGALTAVIAAADPHCRGVLLLGLDAPEADIAAGFDRARDFPMCRGFAVGRTIFGRPAEDWLSGRLGDDALVEAVAERFERVMAMWRARRA